MDAVVVHAEEVEAQHGVFRGLTDPLGVSGFRVNRLELAAGAEGPEHDHSSNGQEEVYAIVGGGGVLRLGEREVALRPGHFVFLPPEVRRQLVAGDEGLIWIGIGSALPSESSS
jgi:quercetin dioxygenase-like cupin family protein